MSISFGRLGAPAGMSVTVGNIDPEVLEDLSEEDRHALDQPKQPMEDMKSNRFRRRYGRQRNGNLGYSK